MIMEQLMREKLLTVKKEMEGFMKESVPFWLENGIDKEYGGYLVCFDSKGKLMKELAVLTPEDKMIVTQTRMIWGFSALLRNGLANTLRAILFPKLRIYFAEFLNEGFPAHLRILFLPTCVGLRYGWQFSH